MLTEGYVLNQRYQILRVLSDKGGMGVIYQATDLSFNNAVVIKHSRFTEQFLKQQHPAMPPDQLRSHAEYLRKAFEREARLVRGLKHHALPTVIDYFTTGDGHQFFVMDFIPGKDFGELLDERLRQNHGPFPLDQVLDWADQLLDALDYLHTRYESPIIHRDLKPSNLKLTPDGRIVLLDFGLAKGATPGMSVVSASIHGYTLQYAPLEQIRGKGTSVRSDLYSLAVTLHHLLTGAMPPNAVDRVAETTSGEADPLRPLHKINSQIPAVVSDAIERAAALNPNGRYATAAEMRAALPKALQPAHQPLPQPPLPPVKEQETIQRDRRFKVDLNATRRNVRLAGNRWKHVAAGGALILAIGVGIALSSGHLFDGDSSTLAGRKSEPVPTVAAPTTTPRPIQQNTNQPTEHLSAASPSPTSDSTADPPAKFVGSPNNQITEFNAFMRRHIGERVYLDIGLSEENAPYAYRGETSVGLFEVENQAYLINCREDWEKEAGYNSGRRRLAGYFKLTGPRKLGRTTMIDLSPTR